MRQLRGIKIQSHDQFYENLSTDKPIIGKAFFDAIAQGPHFVCVVCLRCFFKDQVSSFKENLKTKKIIVQNMEIKWYNDIPSIDNCFYICRACHGHISAGDLPKMAAANHNQLPVIPDFI